MTHYVWMKDLKQNHRILVVLQRKLKTKNATGLRLETLLYRHEQFFPLFLIPGLHIQLVLPSLFRCRHLANLMQQRRQVVRVLQRAERHIPLTLIPMQKWIRLNKTLASPLGPLRAQSHETDQLLHVARGAKWVLERKLTTVCALLFLAGVSEGGLGSLMGTNACFGRVGGVVTLWNFWYTVIWTFWDFLLMLIWYLLPAKRLDQWYPNLNKATNSKYVFFNRQMPAIIQEVLGPVLEFSSSEQCI